MATSKLLGNVSRCPSIAVALLLSAWAAHYFQFAVLYPAFDWNITALREHAAAISLLTAFLGSALALKGEDIPTTETLLNSTVGQVIDDWLGKFLAIWVLPVFLPVILVVMFFGSRYGAGAMFLFSVGLIVYFMFFS